MEAGIDTNEFSVKECVKESESVPLYHKQKEALQSNPKVVSVVNHFCLCLPKLNLVLVCRHGPEYKPFKEGNLPILLSSDMTTGADT